MFKLQSIRTKLLVTIICSTLLSVLIVGAMAIYNSLSVTGESAERELIATSESNAKDLNETMACVETGVNSLAAAVIGDLSDLERLKTDPEYVIGEEGSAGFMAKNCANSVEGTMSYYVKFNPDISAPTAGVLGTRNATSGPFTEITPTDITLYEKTDMAHVGWYFIPINNHRPTWLNPYHNANLNVYMISYTGWWSVQWMGADNDIAPWNMAERIIDNGDGTYYIEVNFGDDPIVGALDEQHMLITGAGFTPLEIYFIDIVHGGGAPKEVVLWQNDGSAGVVSWGGTYRFGLEGHDGNNECIATFPEDQWNIIKNGTFYIQYTAADPSSYQVRFTTGWWSVQWMGADNDIAPWNMAERIIDNGDGTFGIEVNFGDDPIVGSLDEQHLLVTGNGFTLQKLFYYE